MNNKENPVCRSELKNKLSYQMKEDKRLTEI